MFQTLAMRHSPHPRNKTVQRILSRPEVNALCEQLRVAARFVGLGAEMAVSLLTTEFIQFLSSEEFAVI
jgi:hypothetical protein